MTPDGIAAWGVLQRAAGQVRAVKGCVYALDFGVVLIPADAMDALNVLMVETLPEVEPITRPIRTGSRMSDEPTTNAPTRGAPTRIGFEPWKRATRSAFPWFESYQAASASL